VPTAQIYICFSMYYTLFRINAFNYNKLIAGATTGTALMQVGGCWLVVLRIPGGPEREAHAGAATVVVDAHQRLPPHTHTTHHHHHKPSH
jgi:hypothetical protein